MHHPRFLGSEEGSTKTVVSASSQVILVHTEAQEPQYSITQGIFTNATICGQTRPGLSHQYAHCFVLGLFPYPPYIF